MTKHFAKRISALRFSQKQALAEKLGLDCKEPTQQLVVYTSMKNQLAINPHDLLDYAKQNLAKHIVPHKFVQVANLPRTAAGKLARPKKDQFVQVTQEQILAFEGSDNSQDDSQDSDDIFDIFGTEGFAPPSNDVERSLAQIWSEVLGIDEISIHDEFLELGGDSLLSIRILARINKAGLRIASEDFFRYPTVAGQAAAILKQQEYEYDAGKTTGSFELLPIQQWFFEKIKCAVDHWNQSVLLKANKELSFEALQRSVQSLLQHHDALRLSFEIEVKDSPQGQNTKAIQQTYLPFDANIPLKKVMLTASTDQGRHEQIKRYCDTLNEQINLGSGAAVKLVFFESPQEAHNYVACVLHHLIVDAESWRILLEDLELTWQAYTKNQSPVLARKTSSYRLWSEQLSAYAKGYKIEEEIPFWQQQVCQQSLPVDIIEQKPQQEPQQHLNNTVGSSEQIILRLNSSKSESLLKSVSKELGIPVKDILIAALIKSLQGWTGNKRHLIDIEGHGRENLFTKLDISRTLGWFTSVFPVAFNTNDDLGLIDFVKSIHEQISQVPNNGIGHGLLQYYRDNKPLPTQTSSPLCFNYLGRIDEQEGAQASNMTPALNTIMWNLGKTRSDKCLRAYLLELNVYLKNEEIHFEWSFSKNIHHKDTINNLATRMQTMLEDMIDNKFNTEQGQEELFELSDLDNSELDLISKALGGT